MKKETIGELLLNTLSHGIGIGLAITALVLLIIISDTGLELFASIMYGISLIILYLASTLYHAFPKSFIRVRSVFRRIDHGSIFILITGTYTPFLVVMINTFESWTLFFVLWTLSLIGITIKAIWIKRFLPLQVAIYLFMGWSIVLLYEQAFPLIGDAFVLLLLGGLSYTVGVYFFASKFKYSHFIWHLFVLAGSIFHFFSVLRIY